MRKISVLGNALLFAVFGVASIFAQSTNDNWTGYYAGGYVGVTHARPGINASTADVDTPDSYFARSSIAVINQDGARNVSSNGFTGGGQFGYNQQYGRIVVGAEVDFGFQQVKKAVTATRTYPCCAPTSYTLDQEVKSNWLATFRPRIGVTAGKALFYATGGLALTDVRYDSVFTDTFDDALETGHIKKTRAGYTAGGGVEVRIAKRWSAKGEYLFSDFGRISAEGSEFTTSEDTWPDTVFTHAVKMKSHNVRFGVNYRF